MMGVNLGGPLRRLRLIDAFYKMQREKMLSTLVVASAAMKSEQLNELVDKYREALIPTGSYNEEFAEKGRELLDEEAKKIYQVAEVFQGGA
jgi:hypothetical protein